MRRSGVLLLVGLCAAPVRAETRSPLVTVTLSPLVGFRNVSYRDRVSSALTSHQSGAVGLLRAGLEIFPAANQGLPVVSDIGLFGSASRSLRGQTQDLSGTTTFDTLWHQWDLGARWRGVFDGAERLSVSLRYLSERFDFTGPAHPEVLLPAGTMQAWRPGLSLSQPLGAFALSLDGGYRFVVVNNAIGRAFPRSEVGGFDAGASLTWAFHAHGALRLGGQYARTWYKLNPLPGDPYVAGGALDELVLVDLGVHARF